MGFFFFTSPFLIMLIGITIGYFFKPIVLGVITSLAIAMVTLSTVGVLGNDIDVYTYYATIVVYFCLILPMWIVRFALK